MSLLDAVVEFDSPQSSIFKRVWNLWPLFIPLYVGILLTIIHWIWWKYNVWNLHTIPTAKCNMHVIMILRILSSVFKNTVTDSNVLFFQCLRGMCSIHQQLKTGAFYFWSGLRPVIFCFSPELFEAILKNPNNLQKSFDYTFLSLWLKEGLVTSKGAKWKQRRRALTPAFHFRILEDFVGVFDDQSKYMVEKIKNATEKQKCLDIVPYITMCTLDIICETAMGLRIHAQDNHDSFYVKTMHRVAEAFVARVLRPWLWPDWIYFKTIRGVRFKDDATMMDKFTKKVISERKAQLIENNRANSDEGKVKTAYSDKRKAFMDLLLDMHMSDPLNFTEQDIQEEVDSFMFAGHDTTAVGSSWVLYLLGLHPEIQNRVYEEIVAECDEEPDKPLNEECLKKLKYLECVIKEGQRLYPPAPYIARHLQEDVEVNGLKIPKGTTCMLVIYMLHRNEEWFPEPELFDPDRFLPENSVKRHPFAYCPFSAGPRSCIGQKFAVLEEKTMLVNVLRNFKVRSVDTRDKLHLSAEMVLRARGGIKLEFEPRR